jgi:hypothetical protein
MGANHGLIQDQRNNPANIIIKKIAETLNSGPYSSQPWDLRIVLGCWAVCFVIDLTNSITVIDEA